MNRKLHQSHRIALPPDDDSGKGILDCFPFKPDGENEVGRQCEYMAHLLGLFDDALRSELKARGWERLVDDCDKT